MNKSFMVQSEKLIHWLIFWGVHYCLVGHMFALHVQVHLLY